MPAYVGSIVHPWYKGAHEWEVKKVAKLDVPVKYADKEQGQVEYDPKIMLLESEKAGKVLWFPYWMANDNSRGKMKWGQRPSMLEEDVLLKLMVDAIKQGMFSKTFLRQLHQEMKAKLD